MKFLCAGGSPSAGHVSGYECTHEQRDVLNREGDPEFVLLLKPEFVPKLNL